MGGHQALNLGRRKHIFVLQHACVMHQQPQRLGVDWNWPHRGGVKIGNQWSHLVEREAKVDEIGRRLNSAATDVRGARERGGASPDWNLLAPDTKDATARKCDRENK